MLDSYPVSYKRKKQEKKGRSAQGSQHMWLHFDKRLLVIHRINRSVANHKPIIRQSLINNRSVCDEIRSAK